MAITLPTVTGSSMPQNAPVAGLGMAFQMRCDPHNIKMRELIQSGAIGA